MKLWLKNKKMMSLTTTISLNKKNKRKSNFLNSNSYLKKYNKTKVKAEILSNKSRLEITSKLKRNKIPILPLKLLLNNLI